jgi:hypothetical protein
VLPEWGGTAAALAESVSALALLLVVVLALGSFGLLERWPLLIAAGAIAGVVGLLMRDRSDAPGGPREKRDEGEDRRHEHPRKGPDWLLVVLLLIVALPWVSRSLIELRTGIAGYDSLNYHLPFAARFVETGRTTTLHFAFTGGETQFHPLNSELWHAVGMTSFRRDILSPFLNLAFVALALLASWCCARETTQRRWALAGCAALLTCPLFWAFNAGRATNDVVAVALLLASVALLLQPDDRHAKTALSALAAGMALGTKLTMVIPVAALTIGVVAVAPRGRRAGTALAWLVPLTLTGGYWFLRNLVHVGSPVPAIRLGVGPVAFPATTIARPYPNASVADYLTDGRVWGSTFLPGLRDSFGLAWPVLVGLALGGMALAVLRGDRVERMVGAVAVTAALGYVFTPLGAGGPEGDPILFRANLRFAFPAMALGLVLLARMGTRVPRAARRAVWLLLGAVLVGNALDIDIVAVEARPRLAAFAVSAALLGLVFVLARTRRPVRPIVLVTAALVVVITGYLATEWSLDRRYAPEDAVTSPPWASAPREELGALYRWVRGVSDARIALAGLGASYPLNGVDLSNRVEYIGHHGRRGAFDPIRTCDEWRRALNDGAYDYVVVSPNSRDAAEPPQARWTREDSAASEVVRTGAASVFRVTGTFMNDCSS